MTDHLQQKAAEIVREQLGYQVPASLESMRVDHPYEYKCALAGITAGIAMAAPEGLRKELEKAMQAAQDNIKYSMEHNSDDKYWAAQGAFAAYRHAISMLDAALDKGETQHG